MNTVIDHTGLITEIKTRSILLKPFSGLVLIFYTSYDCIYYFVVFKVLPLFGTMIAEC